MMEKDGVMADKRHCLWHFPLVDFLLAHLVSRHASNLSILPGFLCEADRSERFSPMNLVQVILGLDTSLEVIPSKNADEVCSFIRSSFSDRRNCGGQTHTPSA